MVDAGVAAGVAESAVSEFKQATRGQVLCPGEGGYDEARQVWNGNIDRRPALIARCTGVADVIAAVNFAREHRLLVAVRGGGHNAAGNGTCDGGIVIDLSPMKGIWVDPERRIARAQGGVVWGEFDRETQAFGLATTGGTVSNTGIAGLTLGGGLGWLMGKHGLTIDNLLSADIVTADGTFRHASATENPDLFWALRGGSGNFGVVTSFEYQLHPVGPIVIGGVIVHALPDAKEMLRFYRDFCADLPDEAEAVAALLTLPDGTAAAALALAYNGPLEEGEKILAPARAFGSTIADMLQPMPYAVRNTLLDDPYAIVGRQRYWKSGFTETISDELIEVLADAGRSFLSPQSTILLFRLHGAVVRVPDDATAFGMRREQWDLNIISQWVDAADSERQIAWTRAAWGRIEPLISGGAYINHIAADDRPEKVRASYGANYERLVTLKRKYDPENLFRLNANIRPA
jgi:FAD/FMN-containing dehydrogenase